MHFERRNAFQNAKKLYFFQNKKIIKKIYDCVPTLPKVFRPVTQNTFIFLFIIYALLALHIIYLVVS